MNGSIGRGVITWVLKKYRFQSIEIVYRNLNIIQLLLHLFV